MQGQCRTEMIKGGWAVVPCALRRQRQADLCEFEASLVYRSTEQVPEQPGLHREILSQGEGEGGIQRQD